MNKRIKNLNRIEFVVTLACTGRCRHCSQGEHIKSEHINSDYAVKAVYDICGYYHIESLMTFGGEPLLYPKTVCEIHKAARKMNIPKRELITNGYFVKDKTKIAETAHMLSESGVNNIMLSVDAFHQETIPLEYVMEFAKQAVKDGMPVKVHPAWLVSKDNDNPYNKKTRELLKEFNSLGIASSDGNIIFPSGNAKKYLSKYFDKDKKYRSPYEENPEDIRTISFSPNGDVLNGNLYKNNILDILKTYNN